MNSFDAYAERINKVLHHIRTKNTFYFESMKYPKEVKSYDEFKRLGFMTKDILRTGYPFSYMCADQSDVMRFHMSSGTTGTPVINPMTRSDIDQWSDMMERCYKSSGVTKSDIVQITPSFGLFNGGFGFHYGAEKLGAMIVPIGAGRTMLQLKFMEDIGTTCLCAIASYPLRLMELATDNNFDFRARTKLRVGIFGAEVWTDAMRKRIERVMGIDSFDIIGMTETGGVGMGIDCKEHSGIHVWDDHYFVEIINPATGEVLPDGEEGEMVVSTLTREGLPLLRYRTRDVTRVVSREKCGCGLTTLKIARLKGRNDDMLKVKGVNFYPSQIESLLMEFPELSTEYRIILEESKGKGDVTLKIEKAEDVSKDLKDRIHTTLYDFLGFHVNLEIVDKGSIERKEGKAQRVEDRRK
ncbi:MAG TPA: phenylacetate--CoA ligase [Spirochaetota bacterium]|nr:phenylacetate--CoA ligase [Spirochaetota bacterium]